ncbi:MAG: hypothetical protein FWC51_00950 [Proteobacteria bacterium]|nr:hypothetical protein [Pseudomonadota bacterium]
MAAALDKFLWDFFVSYHLSQMTANQVAQWDKLKGKRAGQAVYGYEYLTSSSFMGPDGALKIQSVGGLPLQKGRAPFGTRAENGVWIRFDRDGNKVDAGDNLVKTVEGVDYTIDAAGNYIDATGNVFKEFADDGKLYRIDSKGNLVDDAGNRLREFNNKLYKIDAATNRIIDAKGNVLTAQFDAAGNFLADIGNKIYRLDANGDKISTGVVTDLWFPQDRRTPNMKNWRAKTDIYDKDGNLVVRQGELKTAPDPAKIAAMDIEDWKKFYRWVRDGLRGINDQELEQDGLIFPPDDPSKLAQFFKAERGFKAFSAPNYDTLKKTLKKVGDILASEAAAPLRASLVAPREFGGAVFTDNPTLGEFISGLQSGNYDPTKKIPKKIGDFLVNLSQWLHPTPYSTAPIGFGAIKNELTKDDALGVGGGEITNLQIALDPENEEIDPDQLLLFKEGVYKDILKAFYDPKKADKKSAFYTSFMNAGGTNITKIFDSAIGAANYDEGKNKLAEVPKDKLTFLQGAQKKYDDFMDEHIRKMWKKAEGHIYMEPLAQGLVEAILKEECTPVKGLSDILDKREKIKTRLADLSPGSADGFEALCKVLDKIKGPMKKAFAGALRNGAQNAAIATEIIKAAGPTGYIKPGEARVALETLAVLMYDPFDSAHFDEFKKNKLDMFKDATFMKNKDIALICNGLTSLLNLGLQGGYIGLVYVRNRIQSMIGKLPQHGSKEDKDRLKYIIKKLGRDSIDFKTLDEARAELTRIAGERKAAEDDLNNYKAANPDLDQSYEQWNKDRADKIAKKGELEKLISKVKDQREAGARFDAFNARKQAALDDQRVAGDRVRTAKQKLKDLSKEKKELESKIKEVEKNRKDFVAQRKKLAAALNKETNTALIAKLSTQLNKVDKKIQKLDEPAKKAEIDGWKRRLKQIDDRHEIDDAEKELKDAEDENAKLLDPQASERDRMQAILGPKFNDWEAGTLQNADKVIEDATADALKFMSPDEIFRLFGMQGLESELERLKAEKQPGGINLDNQAQILSDRLQNLEVEIKDLNDRNDPALHNGKARYNEIATKELLLAALNARETQFKDKVQFLEDKELRDQAKDTEEKTANRSPTPEEVYYELSHFYNAARGFDKNINVNADRWKFWKNRDDTRNNAPNLGEQFNSLYGGGTAMAQDRANGVFPFGTEYEY